VGAVRGTDSPLPTMLQGVHHGGPRHWALLPVVTEMLAAALSQGYFCPETHCPALLSHPVGADPSTQSPSVLAFIPPASCPGRVQEDPTPQVWWRVLSCPPTHTPKGVYCRPFPLATALLASGSTEGWHQERDSVTCSWLRPAVSSSGWIHCLAHYRGPSSLF
jgi:hypothetical protein